MPCAADHPELGEANGVGQDVVACRLDPDRGGSGLRLRGCARHADVVANSRASHHSNVACARTLLYRDGDVCAEGCAPPYQDSYAHADGHGFPHQIGYVHLEGHALTHEDRYVHRYACASASGCTQLSH